MNLVPLSYESHATLRLRSLASYSFAKGSALVSLYASEAYRAAHEYPVTFSAEPDGFFPAALLGTAADENLFVDAQGRWLANYIPALWRRGPFRLAKIQASGEYVLCVDLDSEQVDQTEGELLFDAEKKPSPRVAQSMQFLGQLENERKATLAACAVLDRHGLLVPWDLKIRQLDGSTRKLDGLSRVDETRLNELDGETLVELQRSGALALIYAHLFSMQKMALLGRLAGERAKAAEQHKDLKAGKLDLDRVFGIVEDDPFIF